MVMSCWTLVDSTFFLGILSNLSRKKYVKMPKEKSHGSAAYYCILIHDLAEI